MSHATRRVDGSLELPDPKDDFDVVLQSQLRRIARGLNQTMGRITRAREDSRAGGGERWILRGSVGGATGIMRRGID